jgi:PHP domain-containing protein
MEPQARHDVSAVIHAHTTYSDGTASVPELLEAAQEAEVDAVFLTDHDTLGAKRDGWEGAHGGVQLFVGEEVSSKQGHYLSLGADSEVPHEGRTPLEIAEAVREAGGVGIAAHPFSRGGNMLVPAIARRIALPHGWGALDDPRGYDGLEVWSALTDAGEAWRTPAEARRWLRDPELAIAPGPPERHLRLWDELSAHRRVPAIGGLDSHQPGIRVRGRIRTPLPHRRTFRLLRTHLLCRRPLSGEPEADWPVVRAALGEGAAWLACPFVAPAEGARLWAELGDGSVVPMGGEAPAQPAVLRIRLPSEADVRVICDGMAAAELRGSELDVDIEVPGVHRVEARIDGRIWLLSNPVHLRAISFESSAGL